MYSLSYVFHNLMILIMCHIKVQTFVYDNSFYIYTHTDMNLPTDTIITLYA